MADFDADAKGDILWKNMDNGLFHIWLMDENGRKASVWVGGQPTWDVISPSINLLNTLN